MKIRKIKFFQENKFQLRPRASANYMKLISLNTWGGRIPGITLFLEKKKQDTDIFCFQEIYNGAPEALREVPEVRLNFFKDIKVILSDFNGYFIPQVDGVGIASFIRKRIEVERVSSAIILSAEDLSHLKMPDGESYYPRVLQLISLKKHRLTICNFHGVPGKEKMDSQEREIQTKHLLEILNKEPNNKILMGDFNLNPDTNAISALEKIMQNPLGKSSFTSTRSSFYKNRNKLPFADYIFVSPDIKIQSFQVLPDEVSDHLPLALTF